MKLQIVEKGLVEYHQIFLINIFLKSSCIYQDK